MFCFHDCTLCTMLQSAYSVYSRNVSTTNYRVSCELSRTDMLFIALSTKMNFQKRHRNLIGKTRKCQRKGIFDLWFLTPRCTSKRAVKRLRDWRRQKSSNLAFFEGPVHKNLPVMGLRSVKLLLPRKLIIFWGAYCFLSAFLYESFLEDIRHRFYIILSLFLSGTVLRNWRQKFNGTVERLRKSTEFGSFTDRKTCFRWLSRLLRFP